MFRDELCGLKTARFVVVWPIPAEFMEVGEMANDGPDPRLVAVGVRPIVPALSMLACDTKLSSEVLGGLGPSNVPEPPDPVCAVSEKEIALLVLDPRSPPWIELISVVTVPGDT